ncbi:MAG: transposase [Chloroflexi bacterium]|nr:transposase [Chloroflexota bacterium]
MKMRVAEMIDAVWHPHNNWQGLSYGQLAVLFLTYVLHRQTHHLAGMEDWVVKHRTVLEAATGWTIGPKEATDDRLGLLLGALGADEERSSRFQRHMGQHLLQAYALPTAIARYDTTTFSVHHAPPSGAEATSELGLLRFGHSKDRRPDLVQFKQGLGTLDPAGVPLLTMTLAGHQADDPLYVPAWREMAQTIGHRDFLFITDCKGAAVLTRATIAHEGGTYLLPLPLTGDVPAELYAAVANPPVAPTPIRLADVPDEHGEPRPVGQGFIVVQELTAALAEGRTHTWTERRLVTQSTAQATRQQQALHARLRKAEEQLRRLRIKKEESVTDFQARATQVLHQRQVADWLTVQVEETVTERKRYLGRGRPGPQRPYQMVAERQIQLQVHRNEAAIAKALTLAGWRIYVTNTTTTQLPLDQAIDYYRDQWVAERGYHRFKKGSLPALPLFIRLPTRITGLMLLLTVALQALTLLEFVARRELAQRQETVAGLVPGNPRMKTAQPTAERILSQFTHLHLLIEETEPQIKGHLVETLTPLQRRLLALLNVPETVYDLAFHCPRLKFYNST